MSCVYVCVALYNNTRHTTRDHLSKPLIHFQGSPAAGRRRLHLRQRNLERPPSCTRHAPSWAWWYTVHRSIDGVHREKLAGQRRWRCCDGVATPALPFSCGLEPVCGIDMISIAHLASHLLTPGSRVADLNGEMACLLRAAVMLFLTRGWSSIPSITPTIPSMPATPRDPQKP